MTITIAAVSLSIFTACLSPLACSPAPAPPAVVECTTTGPCPNVSPPTRLDITDTDAGECPNMGGEWNDDTLTCEGVDY